MADSSKIKYIKLAQFEAAVSEKKSDSKIQVIVERLIIQGLDVKYRLRPIGSFKFKANYSGSTALHLALDHDEFDIFCSLLENGADYTIKNDEGKTVVHKALDRSINQKEACWKLQGRLKHPYIDAVLQKQINLMDSTNPCNKDGFSHFHAACMTNNVKAVKFFLRNGLTVNKAINKNSKILSGYTPLHLGARYCALEVVNLLLDYNANIHFINTERINPLHMLFERIIQMSNWFAVGERASCEEALNQLLIVQKVMQQILNNSYTYVRSDWADDIGFSCLHAAAFTNDSLVLQTLFEAGYNMKQTIKMDSPVWPGYTALHFAVQCSFEVAMYLLNQGADILAKDAKGITSFDLIMKLHKSKQIHSIILSQDAWKNIVFSDAKTKLTDLVLAMDSQDTYESFLKLIDIGVNIQLPDDSPIWPGFTPLHLALTFPDKIEDIRDLQLDIRHKNYSSQTYNCSEEEEKLYFERIKICLNLGADITIKNTQGSTPLHLAFKQQKYHIVNYLLQFHTKLLNPLDGTGLSHLHIACAARKKLLMENLLLYSTHANDPLPLSLSYQRVHDVEKRQNGNLITFIRDQSVTYVQKIYSSISSKQHIFHMSTGSSLVHIAVAAQCPELMEILLKHGADIYARDGNGLTPLHRMLTVEDPQQFASCLESLTDLRICALEYGLSHLHIVCLAGSESCTRRLLEQGANIEAALTYRHLQPQIKKVSNCDSQFIDPYGDPQAEPMSFLAPYSGYRPLHFAVRANNPSVVRLLLKHGADILAKNAEGSTPLYDAFADQKNNCRDLLIRALKSNVVLQKRMKGETGLTMLHFLCFSADVEAVEDQLIEEVDVNARAHADSPLWAGCSPLHVLMKALHDNGENRTRVITVLMLAHGADVTVTNVENESPIHMVHSKNCCHSESGVRAHSYIVDMLKAQKDFSINPVNQQGISHFHFACMWDLEDVVKDFLTNGIDPNDPIDYFEKSFIARLEHSNLSYYGGTSPLQLAIIYQSKKVFTLLLEWGANLQTVDCQGRNLLHVAADHTWHDKTYFQEIISRRVDINAEDIYGMTAFRKLLCWDEINDEIIKVFIKEGCRVNSFNSVTEEGHLAFCVPNLVNIDKPKPVFELVMQAPNILELDTRGRNAIHNVVSLKNSFALTSSSFVYAIDCLRSLGCDIDLQDCFGRTPLHLAVQFQNYKSIAGLLELGADINLLDADKKPAFACIRNCPKTESYDDIIKIFLVLVCQYNFCKLYVNGINNEIYRQYETNIEFPSSFQQNLHKELARLRERKIGEHSVTLGGFLSETGAVAAYPHMIAEQRQEVDEIFQSEIDGLREDFEIFTGLLLLQYGKARKRVDLLKKAESSFSVLTGLELPYLCNKNVFKFLSNADLEFLIASASSDTSTSK